MNERINQTQRVLCYLQDGEWHTGLEFTRFTHPIMSYTRRIFELRQAGYVIIRERRDGLWKYRLA